MSNNTKLMVATLALSGLCSLIGLITVHAAAPSLLPSHAIALTAGVATLALIVTMGAESARQSGADDILVRRRDVPVLLHRRIRLRLQSENYDMRPADAGTGVLHLFFLVPRHSRFLPFASANGSHTVACFAMLGQVLATLRNDLTATATIKNRKEKP